MKNVGATNKTDMAIIYNIAQFALFIIALIVTVTLVVCLPPIEPIIAQTQEPKKLGGSAAFWITVYSIIALWMLYAWGVKPVFALYKSESFRGRFLSTLLTISRASLMWGILLGISFVTCSIMMELFESASSFLNIVWMLLLIGAWASIEHECRATIAKVFNASFGKERPVSRIIKRLKSYWVGQKNGH